MRRATHGCCCRRSVAVNEPLVDAGRRSRDLLSRLSGEIARARRLYEARVPSLLRGLDYIEQELVKTLADGDSSLLGNVQ